MEDVIETTKGMFRILLWGPGAMPDPNVVRTSWPTYQAAEEQAKRFLGTEEARYGYSILLEVEDAGRKGEWIALARGTSEEIAEQLVAPLPE